MNCSSKKCATDCSILIFIFILLIHIYIVQYLTKLHNNHNHNRTSNNHECLDINKTISLNTILFIKYYSIITIILVVIILFNKLFCSILNISLTQFHHLKPFYLIYSITGLVSIYLLYRLTSTLRLKNCKYDGEKEKEHEKETEILYYYSIIVVSIYVCVIFMSAFISIFYKDLKSLKFI